ncbi:MAG: hypothetical protein ACTHKP_00355 [Nitrososphaeraceae archaeon]
MHTDNGQIDISVVHGKCKVCKQVFDTYEALREHERIMTEVKKYNDHQGYDVF